VRELQLSLFDQKGIVNPLEAPEGYYAVSKESVKTSTLGNICRACDWKHECQKTGTDFLNPNHKCMDYTTVHLSGIEIKRSDGCSVVFKKLS